tara:strand:+ start:2133 stop:8309 length:6177 start_codon:yes stop_codon:yes gene_type:complete
MPQYNVKSPSGETYVVNAPESATQEEIINYAQSQMSPAQSSVYDSTSAPKFDRGLLGSVLPAISRGYEGVKIMAGDTLPAVAGSALGFDDYAKAQLEDARIARQNLDLINPSQVKSFREVDSVYDGLIYGIESIFEQVANVGVTVASGGAGAIAGRALVGNALRKKLGNEAKKLSKGKSALSKKDITAANLALRSEVATAQLSAANTGAITGAFFGSYALNAPEVFNNIYDATGELAPGAALLAGSAAAALDSILPLAIIKQFKKHPALKKEVVGQILKGKGVSPSVLRAAGIGIGKGMALESVTEAAQEAISIAAERIVGDNYEAFTSEEFDRLIEAGLRGGIAGGAFGGVGGTRKGIGEKAIQRRFAERKAEKDAKDAIKAAEGKPVDDAAPIEAPVKTAPVVEAAPAIEVTDEQISQYINPTEQETNRLSEIETLVAEIAKKQQAEGVTIDEQQNRIVLQEEAEAIRTAVRNRAKDEFTVATAPIEAPIKAPVETAPELTEEEAIRKRIADIEGYFDGTEAALDPEIVAELEELRARLAGETEEETQARLAAEEATAKEATAEETTDTTGDLFKGQKEGVAYDLTAGTTAETLGTRRNYENVAFVKRVQEKLFAGTYLSKEEAAEESKNALAAFAWEKKRKQLQKKVDTGYKNFIAFRERVGFKSAPLRKSKLKFLDKAERELKLHSENAPEGVEGNLGASTYGKVFAVRSEVSTIGGLPIMGASQIGYSSARQRNSEVRIDLTDGDVNNKERVENVIMARFGKAALGKDSKLEKNALLPTVRVFNSYLDMVEEAKTNSELANYLSELGVYPAKGAFSVSLGNENVLGVAYKAENTSIIFADRISIGGEFSVFMHEVGVHLGMQGLLGETENTKFTQRILKFAEQKDGSAESNLAIEAIDRIDKNYSDSYPDKDTRYDTELIPHFVDIAINKGYAPSDVALPNAEVEKSSLVKWFSDLINTLRKKFIDVMFKTELTVQDIVDLANGAAQTSMQIGQTDPIPIEASNVDTSNIPAFSLASNVKETMDKTFDYADELISRSETGSDFMDGIVGKLSNIPMQVKGLMWGSLSFWQMSDIVKSFNPVLAQQLKDLDAIVKNRSYEVAKAREAVLVKVQQKRVALRKIKEEKGGLEYAKLLTSMEDFAMDATLNQFDFRKKSVLESKTLDAKQKNLLRRYKALPKPMQEVITDIANENDANREKFIRILGRYIGDAKNLVDGSSMLSEEQLAILLRDRANIAPYFALYRVGGYWISYPNKNFNPNEEESQTNRPTTKRSFENVTQRRRAIAKVIRDGDAIKDDIRKYTPSKGKNNEETASSRILSKTIKQLKASMAQDTTLDNPAMSAVLDQLNEDYMNLFPASNTMNQWKARQGDPGFRGNVVEDYATLHLKQAAEFALFETAGELNDAIEAILSTDTSTDTLNSLREELNNNPPNDPEQLKALEFQIKNYEASTRVIQNVRDRESFLHSPVAGPYARGFSYFGYAYLIMGSIASAAIQLTQVPMVAFGSLGGEYGYPEAAKEIAKAWGTYFRTAGKDDNTTLRIFSGDLLPVGVKGFGSEKGFELSDVSMFAPRDGAKKQSYDLSDAARERLYEASLRGTIVRRSTAQEAVDVATSSDSYFSRAWTKGNLAGGWAFQNMERLNKEVTLLAAFNLDKQKYPTLSEEQHTARAIEITEFINGPSLNESGPSWFYKGPGKSIGTFKKFAFSQLYIQIKLAKNAWNAIEDPTPADIQKQIGTLKEAALKSTDLAERDKIFKNIASLQRVSIRPEGSLSAKEIARRQILGILIPAVVFAGIRGVPFYGALTMIYDLFFEDDDDEELDDLDSMLQEAFGDLGRGGLVGAILGVDFAGRTGMFGYAYRDDPYRREKIGDFAYLIEQTLGPTALIYRNVDKAMDLQEQGHTYRAIETLLPVAVKNPMKALRYDMEGVLNRNGVPIVEDISFFNKLMQLIGWSPYELAQQYRRNELISKKEKRVLNRKEKLKRLYFYAVYAGDTEEEDRVQKLIDEYNDGDLVQKSGNTLSSPALNKSYTTRLRRMNESTNGLYINPKARPAYEEGI